MKSIGLILITLIIAGLEPFWPLGSPVIALAAVLGTKYPNSTGIFAAVFIGLVRDALLVNRLGVSSLIAVFAWFIAAFAAARLGRQLIVSVAAAGFVALAVESLAQAAAIVGWFPGPWYFSPVLATAALAGIFSAIWNFISERDEAIKIRKN